MLYIKINESAAANDAFIDDPAAECCRIIRAIASKIEAGKDEGGCFDYNGNKVGTWWYQAPEPDEADNEDEGVY